MFRGRFTPPDRAIVAYRASDTVDFFTAGMLIIDSGFFYSLTRL